MNILTNYTMELYHLHISDLAVHTSPRVTLIKAAQSVTDKHTCPSTQIYNNIIKNLKRNIDGVLAVCDGEIVGYGWIKFKGDSDKFYRFGDRVAYLSEFFVENSFRGQGIYPSIISQLILSHDDYNDFYISAYSNNISSKKGLEKVGFKRIKTLRFTRFLKVTFRRHKITNKGLHQ